MENNSAENQPVNSQKPKSKVIKIAASISAVVAAIALFVTNVDKIISIGTKWTRSPKESKTEIVITKEALIAAARELEQSEPNLPPEEQIVAKETSDSLKAEANNLPKPVSIQPTDSAPWLPIAFGELGQSEVAGASHNPRIIEYIKSAGSGLESQGDELPWVSFFVNWALQQAGIEGTNSGTARSWTKWGQEITSPQPGAVAVFKRRNHPYAGSVGFLLYESDTRVVCIMGNHANSVSIAALPKDLLLGYRWPKKPQ